LEWWLALLLIFGGAAIFWISGFPVAFAFLLINVIGIGFFWGGEAGLRQLNVTIFASLTNFMLLPVPMFMLMGEIMFESGVAFSVIDAIEKWLGRLHGRLSLLAVASGTLLSVCTGVAMATAALLGRTLVPEMEKRGYKTSMTIGPILGSAGLAIMIPPSSLAVLLAALAEISVAGVLIGGIIPGLIMATLYTSYIIIRSRLQPSVAPPYEVPPVPLSEKVKAGATHILPLGLIVFLVIGVILVGVTTPTEAAATGVFGCLILAAFHRQLNWRVVKNSLVSTARTTVMVLMILAGATAFSQMLAFSGATGGLLELATSVALPPIVFVIAMQATLMIMGMFVEAVAMVMITIPIFYPIILSLGLNPLWFGVLMLLNMEMAATSPPFGLTLFVMKGVAPRGTTMGDIYRGAIPFLLCDMVVMALMIFFPAIILWLPGLMR